jgi:hypothetical protein
MHLVEACQDALRGLFVYMRGELKTLHISV